MAATLEVERTRVDLSFLLRWMLASALGWSAGLMLENTAQLVVEAASGGRFIEAQGGAVLEGLGGLMFGAVLGAMHSFILRGRIKRWVSWTAATAAGFALAGIAGGALEDAGNPVGGLVISFGFGLAAGLLQWLILRKLSRRAGWWIGFNTVLVFAGLITSVALSFALTGAQPTVSYSGAVFAAAGGAIYGITSGPALAWLLRNPAKKSHGGVAHDLAS